MYSHKTRRISLFRPLRPSNPPPLMLLSGRCLLVRPNSPPPRVSPNVRCPPLRPSSPARPNRLTRLPLRSPGFRAATETSALGSTYDHISPACRKALSIALLTSCARSTTIKC